MQCFLQGKSALEASSLFDISYVSTKNYYQEFREICALISEKNYSNVREKNVEYEEYFYIEKSKKHKKDAIFDAHNFLTFDYDGYIYTLLMPSLHRYKKQFLEDNIENVYIEEFNKFKRISRIIKVSKHYNTIVKFWNFFEKNIVVYKGVSNELFAYYLKEFEFKFNHSIEDGLELLIQNYFKEIQ
ncbi:transposase [Sulfurimonas sp.]